MTSIGKSLLWTPYSFGKCYFSVHSYDITNCCRLQEETAKVERYLLEGNFITAILRCFNAPKASAFDYNLLEPLQKVLRLSSPVAAALAQPQLYHGILVKLHHKKAVVRLNLLRMVRSICDASEPTKSDTASRQELFEAIGRLVEGDNAILVRNLAGELTKPKATQRVARKASFDVPKMDTGSTRHSSRMSGLDGVPISRTSGATMWSEGRMRPVDDRRASTSTQNLSHAGSTRNPELPNRTRTSSRSSITPTSIDRPIAPSPTPRRKLTTPPTEKKRWR